MSARRAVRGWPRLAALALAVLLTTVLARSPAAGAFAASAGNGANAVTSASSFCVAPGTAVLAVTNDAWTDQAEPTVKHSSTASLHVRSGVGENRRTYLRFTVTAPRHCTLDRAELRLRNSAPRAGRTIHAYRVDPAAALWNPSSLTWGNQPAPVGTPVPSTAPGSAGIQTWLVTDHVRANAAGPDNGLVLVDAAEGQSGGPYAQVYDEQSGTGTPPSLHLTWK